MKMSTAPVLIRNCVVVVLAIGLVAGIAPAAQAAEPPDLASQPLLLSQGGALGSDSSSGETETVDWPGAGPCGVNRRAGSQSLAVLRVASSAKRLLRMTVTPDDDANEVCLVGVYRSTLTNPQDIAQRSSLHEASTAACATSPSCNLDVWLDAGAAYYVVLWASPELGTDPPARFDYDASIRVLPLAAATVAGHRIADRGVHEVIAGRSFSINATIPYPSGTVRFQYETWTGTGWRSEIDRDQTLSAGAAQIGLVAAAQGRRRFRVLYPGNDTVLSWNSAFVEILFVTPRWSRYADGGARLAVPYARQQYSLSCEAAALRMALLLHGISQDDLQILRRIGIDGRGRSGGRWGDPEKAFVGAVNGSMPTTGYGVHAPPVVRAATSYRPTRPAFRFSQVSFATIAGYLNNGFPVVIWGGRAGSGGIRPMTWTSWEGRRVSAMLIEHTWTLIGFRGPVGNPTHFIVHNPSGAAGTTMTVADVRLFTRHFGNTGVVVR
jgi:uncharacterized protein YvpB